MAIYYVYMLVYRGPAVEIKTTFLSSPYLFVHIKYYNSIIYSVIRGVLFECSQTHVA